MQKHGDTYRYKMDDGLWYVIKIERWQTEHVLWKIFPFGNMRDVITNGEVVIPRQYNAQLPVIIDCMLTAHSDAYQALKDHVGSKPATMKQMDKIMYQVDYISSLNTRDDVLLEIMKEIRDSK